MSRTHVWLLHRGAPDDPSGAALMLGALANARGHLPGWLSWWGGLGRWLWRRWWTPRLLTEPATSADPLREEAELQARKLGAVLGEGYAVRPVFGLGEDGPSRAASYVGARERVILLDLAANGGALSRDRRTRSLDELSRRGATVVEAPPLLGLDGYCEALAETARAAIADLPAGTRYEVLAVALDLPGQDAEAGSALSLAASLAAHVNLDRPCRACFLPGPGLRSGDAARALQEAIARGPAALVLVPLNAACEHSAEIGLLDRLIAELAVEHPGVRLARARAPGSRPTFIRALAEAAGGAEGRETQKTGEAV